MFCSPDSPSASLHVATRRFQEFKEACRKSKLLSGTDLVLKHWIWLWGPWLTSVFHESVCTRVKPCFMLNYCCTAGWKRDPQITVQNINVVKISHDADHSSTLQSERRPAAATSLFLVWFINLCFISGTLTVSNLSLIYHKQIAANSWLASIQLQTADCECSPSPVQSTVFRVWLRRSSRLHKDIWLQKAPPLFLWPQPTLSWWVYDLGRSFQVVLNKIRSCL